MRGEIVIVRAFDNQPKLRRIWDVDENAVYITDDIHYQLLLAGQTTLKPVGFPKEDVFKYKAEIVKSLHKGIKWSKLEVWEPTGEKEENKRK